MKNSGWKYWKNTNNQYHSFPKKFLLIIIIGWFLIVPTEIAFSRKTSNPEIKKDVLYIENQNQFKNKLTIHVMDVKAEDLNIDLKENVLTLNGDVKNPEGDIEVLLLGEYRTGKYYRQFNLSEIINQEKIEAAMNDCVLRLTLPKVETAKPCKITVKASQ